MDDHSGEGSSRRLQTWIVGASYRGEDLTDRFVGDGVWEIYDPSARDRENISHMREGDRIAIKSTFTQKHGLGFDTNGHRVSVMRFKARGTITRIADGFVSVDWTAIDPPRDWYFYTSQKAIWRLSDAQYAQELKSFVFDDTAQDTTLFLSDPMWADRYRVAVDDPAPEDRSGFSWIPFFEDLATALTEWRDRRGELARIVAAVREDHGQSAWQDKFTDGTVGPLRDIEPVTAMAAFNLGPTPWHKRQSLAQGLADRLGLDTRAPSEFKGIPVTHPQKSWLFRWARDRGDAVEHLWDVFEAALRWADAPDDAEKLNEFKKTLGPALESSNWTLMTGLYRARPNFFFPLDRHTQAFLVQTLGVEKRPDYGTDGAVDWYLDAWRRVHEYLRAPSAEVSSIPEISDRAWEASDSAEAVVMHDSLDVEDDDEPLVETESYSMDDLIADGCFVPREVLDRMHSALRRNKNVILQGAPGTGKTWLAKRLAWVLAGTKSTATTEVVQFHPNTTYEDFIRGYRPISDEEGAAGLRLVDGPFLRLADAAHESPYTPFTMVIEEINRGNPARAFGEMLTLLESSKRFRAEAIRLTYARSASVEPDGVWLPSNLFTIGTMNIADRSLALVDLALRRRFAFFTLKPQLSGAWSTWVTDRTGSAEFAQSVGAAATRLNSRIAADPALGENFVLGHSFFTPAEEVDAPLDWFADQVEWSIRPLLHEYWHDRPETARDAADELFRSFRD